jgi:hypothetical protein
MISSHPAPAEESRRISIQPGEEIKSRFNAETADVLNRIQRGEAREVLAELPEMADTIDKVRVACHLVWKGKTDALLSSGLLDEMTKDEKEDVYTTIVLSGIDIQTIGSEWGDFLDEFDENDEIDE